MATIRKRRWERSKPKRASEPSTFLSHPFEKRTFGGGFHLWAPCGKRIFSWVKDRCYLVCSENYRKYFDIIGYLCLHDGSQATFSLLPSCFLRNPEKWFEDLCGFPFWQQLFLNLQCTSAVYRWMT
jgi:hypothetical protein